MAGKVDVEAAKQEKLRRIQQEAKPPKERKPKSAPRAKPKAKTKSKDAPDYDNYALEQSKPASSTDDWFDAADAAEGDESEPDDGDCWDEEEGEEMGESEDDPDLDEDDLEAALLEKTHPAPLPQATKEESKPPPAAKTPPPINPPEQPKPAPPPKAKEELKPPPAAKTPPQSPTHNEGDDVPATQRSPKVAEEPKSPTAGLKTVPRSWSTTALPSFCTEAGPSAGAATAQESGREDPELRAASASGPCPAPTTEASDPPPAKKPKVDPEMTGFGAPGDENDFDDFDTLGFG